jgi:hypothetical protein
MVDITGIACEEAATVKSMRRVFYAKRKIRDGQEIWKYKAQNRGSLCPERWTVA